MIEDRLVRAAGAGLPEDELLLLACAYEKYMGAAPGADGHSSSEVRCAHCTALGAAGDATIAGDVICGQNNDELMADWLGGAADVVVHHTDDDGLQILIYTHAGVPAYMGMNSAGLCVTAICQHPKPDTAAPGKTLASMVFEPAAGIMHLAFGNGCEVPYAAYRFDT